MTSRNLYFKLIKQDFKKRIWCSVLIFIACFLVMEVRLIMALEEPLGHSEYDMVTFVREYFFGGDAGTMAFVACGAAFLCGISGYAYLHAKAQLDLYHSLPVSRSQLFWSKYVSGIMQFFLPFVVHVCICAGIAASKDAFTMGTIPALLRYVGLQLVIFILTYSVSVIATELTGNLIVSILATAVLFSYSAIISLITSVLFNRFFHTYIEYGDRDTGFLNSKIWCFSPLSMLAKLFAVPNDITISTAKQPYTYDVSYVWVLAAAAVVYSLAAYFIYLKRASEAAGQSIAFRMTEPVIKTVIVIPISFLIALFFCQLSESESDGWFLFGLIFGFVIVCCLMEIIFRLDIRSAFMHKKQFLFNVACTALLLIVLKFDVVGYDTYVPADSQIQSCAVSIQQLIQLQQYIHLNGTQVHYQSPDEYRMIHMELQENPSVIELARKAAKERLTYRYFDYYEGIEENEEYMEVWDRQVNYRNIIFGYKLLNGKTVYRKYMIDISDADTMRLLADIFADENYKAGSTPIFGDSRNVTFDLVRCESNFKVADIKLTPDMQAKLIETYQKEYVKLTLNTVMHESPIGTINFEDREGSSYGYIINESGEMLIYPQFTETVALLKTYGFDMGEKLTADDIEIISVQSDVETDAVEYTDKEQIQQILDNAVNRDLLWQVDEYACNYDYEYTIRIRFEVQDGVSAYYCFIKGQIPEFVQQDFGL